MGKNNKDKPGEAPEAPSATLDSLAAMLETMRQELKPLKDIPVYITQLRADIRELKIELSTMQEKFQSVSAKCTEVEERFATHETSCNEKIASLISRVDQFDSALRRRSLKVLGLTGVEARTNAEWVDFMVLFFREVFKLEHAYPLDIEKVNRFFSPHREGEGTQVISVQFLKIATRDDILAKFRQYIAKEPLRWGTNERKIMIFPDYAKHIAEARKRFKLAKDMARQLRLEYYLGFPAVLSITHAEETRRFSSPKKAEKYLQQIKDQS